MLVVDASVVAPLIADGGPDGELFRAAARGQTLAAPDLLRVEALQCHARAPVMPISACGDPSPLPHL